MSASSRPYCCKKLWKLWLPPLSILSTSSLVHSSRLTLLILTIQLNSLKAAAQSRQRKMANDSQAHCLLGLPQCRHFRLASCWNRLISLSVGPAYIQYQYIIILFVVYIHFTYNYQVINLPQYSTKNIFSVVSNQMNLKINKSWPYPPQISHPYLFTTISDPNPQLLLYFPPSPPVKAEEPNKKKFTFKPKQPVNTVQPVYLFDLDKEVWKNQETKGKFPSKRAKPAHSTLNHCLMVYGGTNLSNNKPLNDLYALNFDTWLWKKLFTMEAPPAFSNPIAVTCEDKLVVIQQNVWIFNTKGVNWEAQATDLPGGVWQKTDLDVPFIPLCACLYEDDILILGKKQGIVASLVNLKQNTQTVLQVQGQIRQKCDNLTICSTSEDKGLLVDGNIFVSFFVHENILYLSDPIAQSDHLQQLTSVRSLKVNFGLTIKKEFASIQIILPESQPEHLDTARQITQENPHHSSFVEREHEEVVSSRPPPSSLSTQGLTNPILNRLSPLLAREWLRRRVLEEKGKLLEDTIKKAERMVLALCKYGNEEEKQLHITRVCKLRESLCKVLQSETFIRREMTERSGEKELRAKALKDENGADFFDLSQL